MFAYLEQEDLQEKLLAGQLTGLSQACQGACSEERACAHLGGDSYKALARSRVVQARVRQAVRHALEALAQQHTLSLYKLHWCN